MSLNSEYLTIIHTPYKPPRMPATAPAKKKQQTERIVPVHRLKKVENDRPDIVKLLEDHKPDQKLIERIKNADPDKPFYLEVTREMALTLLTFNDPERNRRLKWGKIDSIVSDILEHEWERTGHGLMFSKTNKLIDGQNRLIAIYIANTPCELLVTTGFPEKAMTKVDNGTPRSAADMMDIRGYKNLDTTLAYAIKSIIYYERKLIFKGGLDTKDVPNYKVDKWAADKAKMEWMVTALDLIKHVWMKHNKEFFTAAQWLAVFYILKSLPGMEKKAKQFLEQFAEGASLSRNNPIKVCRGYFERKFEDVIKYNRKKKICSKKLTLKVKFLFAAWDLMIEGASVSSISVDLDNMEIKKPSFR